MVWDMALNLIQLCNTDPGGRTLSYIASMGIWRPVVYGF